MNINGLKILGWDEFFAKHFQPFAAKGYASGRVASESKQFYSVYSESGKVLGEIAGKLRHEALDRGDLPVVGDWVDTQSLKRSVGKNWHALRANARK